MRTKPAAPSGTVIAATSSSLTHSPAPRKPAPMIARLQPAAAETFREGDEIVGAEGGLELGERAEREHEPPPCSAEFRLDLTAMLIRHGLPSRSPRPAPSVAPD